MGAFQTVAHIAVPSIIAVVAPLETGVVVWASATADRVRDSIHYIEQ